MRRTNLSPLHALVVRCAEVAQSFGDCSLRLGLGHAARYVLFDAHLRVKREFVRHVTLDVGAISARFDLGKVKPYLAVTFPLDDDTRQIMNAGVTVGFSATP